MSRDFDKAQEMVWASMEYVKVLGFRLRRTEVQRDDWKKVAQSHADELIKCRQQIDALKKERDGFFVQIQDMRAEPELHELRKLRARAHPVKVGEYVKNDNGDVCQVHEVYAEEYLLNTGWTWAFENCTPCDPPTASHDTPAGKETAQAAAEPKPGDTVRLVRIPSRDVVSPEAGNAAAGAALKTEPVAEEIKVGDLVEVVSNTGRNTWLADVGSVGTVVTVEEINDSISVCLDDVPGKKNALAGYVSFCDVRKVTT